LLGNIVNQKADIKKDKISAFLCNLLYFSNVDTTLIIC